MVLAFGVVVSGGNNTAFVVTYKPKKMFGKYTLFLANLICLCVSTQRRSHNGQPFSVLPPKRLILFFIFSSC